MRKTLQPVSVNGVIMLMAVIANAIVLENGITSSEKWYWGLLVTVPLLGVGINRRKVKELNVTDVWERLPEPKLESEPIR